MHKGLCVILVATILSIVIGNIIVGISGLCLKDINATVEIYYLMIFPVIEIILLSLFEVIDKVFSLKEIREALIICLVVYFIPFFLKWGIHKDMIVKRVDERFSDLYSLNLSFIESDDLIISLRYIMTLLVATLILFYIKNSIKINREMKSIVLRWGVCFLLCLSLSYTYLNREKLIKNERWSILQDTTLIMQCLSEVQYAGNIRSIKETLNSTEKILSEIKLNSICSLEQQIIEDIRLMAKGECWKTFYEKDKEYNFIGLKSEGYEVEEGIGQLEKYMQLKDDERLLIIQKLVNDVIENYKMFIISKGMSSYWGLWTPTHFKEKMNEWLYNQDRLIQHKYMLFNE